MTDPNAPRQRPDPSLWAKLRAQARAMRRAPTPAERVLWERLRDHRLDGAHFRRQHVVDRFIVDFYCPAARLVIEVDGSIHNANRGQDAARDAILTAHGLRVLRVTNAQVLTGLDAVVARIAAALASPGAQP